MNGLKMLVVDDDKFIRTQIERLFTGQFNSIIAVKTAEDAFRVFANEGADIIITDIYMEGMTGTELIVKIKEMNAEVPVIAITGDNSIELERVVRGLGIFAYFMKPLETSLLKKTVEAAVLSTGQNAGNLI